MIHGSAWRARARFVSLNKRWLVSVNASPPKRQPFLPRNLFLRCVTTAKSDQEWLQPNDSPSVEGGKSLEGQHLANQIQPNSSEDFAGDEVITIVDLEKTLNNPSNQQHLQELIDHPDDKSEVSSPEFKVTSSNVEWKDVLRDLREAGETATLGELVKEYNLESHLAALDSETEIEDEEEKKNAEDWDGEFEESLRGLPREEIINELIENSPALSQLEMDIISDEIEKSDLHLDDLDLEENPAVKEFREMVWEDYNEKKQTRIENEQIENTSSEAAATTNWSTREDLSEYPPDWKDYDSKEAFRSDFLEDEDSWIPPSAEMIPSRSQKLVEEKNGERIQNPQNNMLTSADDLDNTIDWLQARRSRLGDTSEENKQIPTHLMTPDQAEKFSHRNSQIPIKMYTLFTTSELSTSLIAQGGTDVRIINTADCDPVRGVGIGCNFILFVTGRSALHIRVMADSIVRNMKDRKLHERGVTGAMQGAEGGRDIFTSKRSLNRARRNSAVNTSRKIDDDWFVVDCNNIHVHLMEATTRKCLNIESLWDLSDPSELCAA